MKSAPSNMRLKPTGGDRFKGSGVLCPWRGTDCRPPALRRRAGRPQLKRDPLGSVTRAMTRLLSVTATIAILTVRCVAQAPARGPARAEWDSLVSHLPTAPQAATAALESFRLRRGLFFTLWADSTVDSTQYPLDDAPCGVVASAFMGRLPITTHPLSVELAVEIDSLGHELRRWPLPLDTRIDGVRDAVLLVPYRVWTGADTRVVGDMAIEASGAFQLITATPAEASPEQVTCPAVRAFAGSAYTTCERFLDQRTKRRRLIAYQAPCT